MRISSTPGSVSGRRIDRVGDPLDGLINLFDLALALAVGLLLAALSSAGVVGLVAGTGAGAPIAGEPSGSQTAQGKGTAVGTVYRLENGSYVFAPSGSPRGGATGSTGAVPNTVNPSTGMTPQTTTPQTVQPSPGSGSAIPQPGGSPGGATGP